MYRLKSKTAPFWGCCFFNIGIKPDMTKNGRITQLLAAGIDTALPMNNRTIDGVN
jgi:N-acetylglutamate synthase-like GNAT family acetyltransferase